MGPLPELRLRCALLHHGRRLRSTAYKYAARCPPDIASSLGMSLSRHAMELMVSDDHPGLKKVIAEVLRPGNAMSTSSGTRSTTCPARSTTIACFIALERKKGGVAPCRLTMLRPTKGMGHPSLPPSLASAALGASERRRLRGDGFAEPHDQFAELDAHNCTLGARRRMAKSS
jgi:hypothetical protein